MNVDIQEVAPCRKRLQVDYDSNEVSKAFDDAFNEVRNSAQLPGFRRGHAPKKMLERKFSGMVAKDVSRGLFERGFVAALKDNNVSPLGEPDINIEELSAERGEAFTFSTEIDVRPVFDLADYKKLSVEEKVNAVTDDEVNERIESLKQNFADYVPVDTPAEEGNLLEGTVVLTVGEEEIFNQESRALKVEGTTVFGIEVGDLVKVLGGLTVDAEKEVKLKIPDTYPREDLRGKKGLMKITVSKVLRVDLPEIDEAFAGRLGMDSVDALREQINSSIEMDRKNAARQETEEQMITKLIELNQFDIPEELTTRQAERNLEQAKMRMLYAGTAPEALDKADDEMKSQSREDAERMIRRMIILDMIAEREEVKVTEQDFHQHISQLASAYRTTPEQMLKEINSRGGLASVEHEIRDIKVTRFLLDNAEITTEIVSE